MKVVYKVYGNDDVKYLVHDDLVRNGVCFGVNDHILCDDDRIKEIHKEWLELKDNDESDLTDDERMFLSFYIGDRYNEVEYGVLNSEEYYSEQELFELQDRYTYAIDSYDYGKIIRTDDFFDGFPKSTYLTYWENGSRKEEEVEILNDDNEIEVIEKDLEFYNKRKTGQYDLYKIDGVLTLVYDSYYQGELNRIEKEDVTLEELHEQFGYEVNINKEEEN